MQRVVRTTTVYAHRNFLWLRKISRLRKLLKSVWRISTFARRYGPTCASRNLRAAFDSAGIAIATMRWWRYVAPETRQVASFPRKTSDKRSTAGRSLRIAVDNSRSVGISISRAPARASSSPSPIPRGEYSPLLSSS